VTSIFVADADADILDVGADTRRACRGCAETRIALLLIIGTAALIVMSADETTRKVTRPRRARF
jgi:hypothetical protein